MGYTQYLILIGWVNLKITKQKYKIKYNDKCQ